ncbi:hypothetical protein JYK22_15410, partial [Nonomuraea sp. RK-328]|nr:hypothetical protein [Nonomuraea sp. RK-328]
MLGEFHLPADEPAMACREAQARREAQAWRERRAIPADVFVCAAGFRGPTAGGLVLAHQQARPGVPGRLGGGTAARQPILGHRDPEAMSGAGAAGMAEAVVEPLVPGDSRVRPHECEFDRVAKHQLALLLPEERDLRNFVDVYDVLH